MKELLEAIKVLREEDWEVYEGYDDDLTLEKSDLIINIGKRGHIEWEFAHHKHFVFRDVERKAIGKLISMELSNLKELICRTCCMPTTKKGIQGFDSKWVGNRCGRRFRSSYPQ